MGRELKPPKNKRTTDSAKKNCATCGYWLFSRKHEGTYWHYICLRNRAHVQPENAKTTVCDGWRSYPGVRDI